MRLDYLAALSGLLIALQSRVNGELSSNLHSSIQAALISFATGLIAISFIGINNYQIKLGLIRLKNALRTKEFPWWGISGGMLGGIFIAFQSMLIPKVGVAVLSVGYIAGQTVTSLVIDKIGFTGGGAIHISKRRVLAASLTVVGVIIAVWDKLQASSITIITAILTVSSGVVVAVQRALNGKVNEVTNQNFSTSLVNFFMGTSLLTVLFVFLYFFDFSGWSSLPNSPWWMYTGGIWGVLYIAFAATVVQHLGVLHFILYSVGGQLLGSLFLDLIIPVTNLGVSLYLIVGILFSYLGVVVSNFGNPNKLER
jgi:transporter family-2 protein